MNRFAGLLLGLIHRREQRFLGILLEQSRLNGFGDRRFLLLFGSQDVGRALVPSEQVGAVLGADEGLQRVDAGEQANEIGRRLVTLSTTTSIAWAVVEHLHGALGCRALFATHYHELTLLTDSLARLACHSMQVKEWQGEIIFMHRVAAGAADRSYGIHVAKLAGLPATVIARAEEVLRTLEENQGERVAAKLEGGLPLFSFAEKSVPPVDFTPPPDNLRTELQTINPDELTPKEALEALYRLKEKY